MKTNQSPFGRGEWSKRPQNHTRLSQEPLGVWFETLSDAEPPATAQHEAALKIILICVENVHRRFRFAVTGVQRSSLDFTDLQPHIALKLPRLSPGTFPVSVAVMVCKPESLLLIPVPLGNNDWQTDMFPLRQRVCTRKGHRTCTGVNVVNWEVVIDHYCCGPSMWLLGQWLDWIPHRNPHGNHSTQTSWKKKNCLTHDFVIWPEQLCLFSSFAWQSIYFRIGLYCHCTINFNEIGQSHSK